MEARSVILGLYMDVQVLHVDPRGGFGADRKKVERSCIADFFMFIIFAYKARHSPLAHYEIALAECADGGTPVWGREM